LKPSLTVTYGRTDVDKTEWFTATNCAVDNSPAENVRIVCDSAPGYGAHHVWRVEVSSAIDSNEGDGTSDSSAVTSYFTPSITSVSAADLSKTIALDTRGN